MKTWVVFLTLALGSVSMVAAEKEGPTASPVSATGKVTAYYFHSTRRCATCLRIEALSEQALRKAFADELERGDMEWRVVNVDEAANRHFIKDFELYTSSLVLVSVDQAGLRWKNLERVWQLVGEPEAFQRYVEDEARGFVRGSS